MKCDKYRGLYDTFMAIPLQREAWESDLYTEWVGHSEKCSSCGDWNMRMQMEKKGINLSDYPCTHIAYYANQLCQLHKDPWECPDIIIIKENYGFGIPIRDGVKSSIKIKYCPWCGIKINK